MLTWNLLMHHIPVDPTACRGALKGNWWAKNSGLDTLPSFTQLARPEAIARRQNVPTFLPFKQPWSHNAASFSCTSGGEIWPRFTAYPARDVPNASSREARDSNSARHSQAAILQLRHTLGTSTARGLVGGHQDLPRPGRQTQCEQVRRKSLTVRFSHELKQTKTDL